MRVAHTRDTSFKISMRSDGGWQYRQAQFVASSIDAPRGSHQLMPFTHIPYEHDAFAGAAGLFFSWPDITQVEVLVDHIAQLVDRSLLRPVDTLETVGPVWCAVGTIVSSRPYGPGGQEHRGGTKHFAPGAKVYYTGIHLVGVDPLSIEVVGRHRASHRFVKMVIRAEWVTRWRVELVYSPHLIRELWPTWDGTQEAKARATEAIAIVKVYCPDEPASPEGPSSQSDTLG
jgi:hypothetical protein